MKINSVKNFTGVFCVAGDKSITHRAVMFNAMANGKSTIKKALLGEDCLTTIDCMRKLGSEITINGDTISVIGTKKFNDNTSLYCGNSGTTIRLLMGLLSGKNINATLNGDDSLSKRPMKRVAQPLQKLGAQISTNNGFTPVIIKSAPLKGAVIEMEVASAQVKSAIILAAVNAEGVTEITEKTKSRNHTELMLKSMGADIECINDKIIIKKSVELAPISLTVPADISSAAYFMALGALLGETTVKNVGINDTRDGILKVFDMMGVKYILDNIRFEGLEKVADITVYKSDIKAIKLTKEIMPSLIDELPVIAVMLSLANGVSTISGAEELRVKESDRIKTTVEMIKNLGGNIKETTDGFIISGSEFLTGGNIDSFFDHRIAMSGTVGLMASKNGGNIKNSECVNISFPDFFKLIGEQ